MVWLMVWSVVINETWGTRLCNVSCGVMDVDVELLGNLEPWCVQKICAPIRCKSLGIFINITYLSLGIMSTCTCCATTEHICCASQMIGSKPHVLSLVIVMELISAVIICVIADGAHATLSRYHVVALHLQTHVRVWPRASDSDNQSDSGSYAYK